MEEICDLKFKITCKVNKKYADNLGKDLATFLEESWFNGEDTIKVSYEGFDLNKN